MWNILMIEQNDTFSLQVHGSQKGRGWVGPSPGVGGSQSQLQWGGSQSQLQWGGSQSQLQWGGGGVPESITVGMGGPQSWLNTVCYF